MDKKGTVSDLGTGKLLIAEPFMQDGFFSRSVIFITDYHESGTVGFILNRPLRMNLKNLISDFPQFPGSVFVGGPVSRDTVHYIHTAGEILEGSKEIITGVYWGGEFNQLKFLISNGVIKPRDIRFFVGYSGWSPGQLEFEMEESNSWLVENSDPNYIFYPQNEIDLWQQILSHKGNSFKVLASMPEQNNSLN